MDHGNYLPRIKYSAKFIAKSLTTLANPSLNSDARPTVPQPTPALDNNEGSVFTL